MSIESFPLEDASIPEQPEQEKPEMSVEQAEFKKKIDEMETYEKAVTPEIEQQYKKALGVLHEEIQSVIEKRKKFPKEKDLKGMLEEIPLFAKMMPLPKDMFVASLMKDEEFKSPDREVFVKHGVKALGFFIHMSVLKKGGNMWLKEKMEQSGSDTKIIAMSE